MKDAVCGGGLCLNDAVLCSTDTNGNFCQQRLSDCLMERKAHYDSILDRSKRITWQDDCYVDLQSTSCSISSRADTEGKSFFNRFTYEMIHGRKRLFSVSQNYSP